MISYAFKYRRYFSNGNHEAQVSGSGLQQSKDLDDLTINFNFEPVDYIVMGQNICRKITIAFYKCLHCSVEGGFGLPSDLHDQVPQLIHSFANQPMLFHILNSPLG